MIGPMGAHWRLDRFLWRTCWAEFRCGRRLIGRGSSVKNYEFRNPNCARELGPGGSPSGQYTPGLNAHNALLSGCPKILLPVPASLPNWLSIRLAARGAFREGFFLSHSKARIVVSSLDICLSVIGLIVAPTELVVGSTPTVVRQGGRGPAITRILLNQLV